MRHTTKSLFLGLATLAAGCTSPSSPTDTPPNDDAVEVEEVDDRRAVGLPEHQADVNCVEPSEVDFAEWVYGPDAVVVATVEDVSFNRDLVFTSSTPTEEIAWEDCDQHSVAVSLTVSITEREVLAGSVPDGPLEVVIGNYATAQWNPRPYWDADLGSLEWGGDGEVLGPGMQLGMVLLWDEHWQRWSAQWLFDVEPDGALRFPQHNECVHLPAQFSSQTLADFEGQVANTPRPTDEELDDGRLWMMPDDDDVRAYHYLATACIEAGAPQEPPPRDPEANP